MLANPVGCGRRSLPSLDALPPGSVLPNRHLQPRRTWILLIGRSRLFDVRPRVRLHRPSIRLITGCRIFSRFPWTAFASCCCPRSQNRASWTPFHHSSLRITWTNYCRSCCCYVTLHWGMEHSLLLKSGL